MRVIDDPLEMRRWSLDRRRHASSIAVVPTMGALHDGHLALIVEARRRAETVIVTIFVNPRQFDRVDDFEKYPRPVDDDVAACRDAGVTAVYTPKPAAMYPAAFETTVTAGSLALPFEGAMRPGHFDGVVTVVTKLLAATASDVAVFGEKDFQQLAIIRRMVRDLDFGIEIQGVPIV
ncbi:MAG TPA: pantoate--beta-alanine ligase, partial [Ilumatobacteraceae bacterium]